MKIIEDSPSRLVLKEGALTGRLVGILFLIIGIGMAVAGLVAVKAVVLVGAGIIFAACGLLALLFTKSDVVVADKTARQLTVTFASLTKRQGQSQQFSFDDVRAVTMVQGYQQVYNGNDSNGNNGSGITFGNNNTSTAITRTLSVQMKDGTLVTVADEQQRANLAIGINTSKLVDKGQKLAAALGVPFQDAGIATPGELIQGIKQAVTGQQPTPFVAPQPTTPLTGPMQAPPPAPAPPSPSSPAQPVAPSTPIPSDQPPVA